MKTVVITGASRGIGKATAIRFAKEKYNVVVCYNKSKEQAEMLADQLNKVTRAVAMQVDVSKEEQVANMVESVCKQFGGIDVLVNNAGVACSKMIIDMTEDDYNNIMDTNLKGVFNMCKHVGRVMLSAQCGAIVNVSSVWGVVGGSCESVYSASKGGVIALTKALAKEFGPNGINVNAVAPGFIETDMTSAVDDAIKADIAQNVPLGRLGRPEDVAGAILFLASEESKYITGQVLGVDGGWQD